MVIEGVTRLVRKFFLAGSEGLAFHPARGIDLSPVDRIDLYIHIPFCKSMCPYCPYNKIRYENALVRHYLDAVLAELAMYRARIGRARISSIYIGGGTPTNLTDELGTILNAVRRDFEVEGPVAVETTPSDVSDKVLAKLKRFGVGMLSLGAQSFDDRFLRLLGRNYNASILPPVIERTLSHGFETVNIDLMFALPGQGVEEALTDIDTALSLGIDHITLYPLFTFPYTSAGKFMRLRQIRMPGLARRRRMYRAIHRHLLDRGFQRVSVWGFKRGEGPRYSSVTRDHYIGLGAGSASCLPGVFYFNTFSVTEYIRTCLDGRMPVALKMDVFPSLFRYYQFYWRLYDTCIPKSSGQPDTVEGRKIARFMHVARLLGLCKSHGDYIHLTEPGAFWLHLVQNYFILNYIDKVWSVAMNTPWPGRIEL